VIFSVLICNCSSWECVLRLSWLGQLPNYLCGLCVWVSPRDHLVPVGMQGTVWLGKELLVCPKQSVWQIDFLTPYNPTLATQVTGLSKPGGYSEGV
jgi:hypothetical protein